MPQRDAENRALGQAVRELREKRGLKQEELAQAAGIHVVYLSGIERGERNPTWAVVVGLAEALRVKPSRLAGRAEQLVRS
jgi:transcriptional regulator with XRE-family HTH domain